MIPARAAVSLLLLISGLAGGCLGGSRPEKTGGSALWLTRDSGEFTAEAQDRLAALGLKEIYLDSAELDWSGGVRLRRIQAPAIPPRTPTTLVISGLWLPGDRPPEQLATGLLSELSSLRIEAEQKGLLVTGFHFAVDPAESAESFAITLGRLRSGLGKNLFLSVGLGRKSLEGPEAEAIADGADYVVSLLYGQRPGEAEDPTAWDLQAVEQNFRRLEALRKPYFTGAITLGTATWRGRDGKPKGQTTTLALGELIGGRNLELKPGFSLQGIDRQVWEFVAKGAARVGEWDLAKGESVRVVRTATSLIEEFRRRVGAWDSPSRLGEVFYRLPREGEKLSLSVDNLVGVLAPDAAIPVIALTLERVASSPGRWLIRARLSNQSSESTDLAFFDSNFVEIAVTGATIGEVEPGDFQRVELLIDGEKGTMRAFREANTVRLFLPLVAEHREAASGAIELKLADRTPAATISGTFLLADGRTLAIEPQAVQLDKP
jgi:hypothetical protein